MKARNKQEEEEKCIVKLLFACYRPDDYGHLRLASPSSYFVHKTPVPCVVVGLLFCCCLPVCVCVWCVVVWCCAPTDLQTEDCSQVTVFWKKSSSATSTP